jgi:hypothetical protein
MKRIALIVGVLALAFFVVSQVMPKIGSSRAPSPQQAPTVR